VLAARGALDGADAVRPRRRCTAGSFSPSFLLLHPLPLLALSLLALSPLACTSRPSFRRLLLSPDRPLRLR
jgi:hypothetical protein